MIAVMDDHGLTPHIDGYDTLAGARDFEVVGKGDVVAVHALI